MAPVQESSLSSSPPQSAHVTKKSIGADEDMTSSLSSTMTLGSSFASTRRVPARGHPVAISDRQLYNLAVDTASSIQWDSIMRSAEGIQSRWRWMETRGSFSVFTKQVDENYAVLSVGAVPCSASELLHVLHAGDPAQHQHKTSALYGDEFRSGAFVYEVGLDTDRLATESSSSNSSLLTDIAVKTTTFTKANWLRSHEEWCYLESLHRHAANGSFEKHTTTLHPKDLVVGKSDRRTKFFHDVTTGYYIQPEDKDIGSDPQQPAKRIHATRVHFYAEYTPKTSPLITVPLVRLHASDKIIKQRLIKMAQSCERLTQLVRRRRLGVQVLVDQKRIFPPTNTNCWCCDKSVLVAKLCRVCGQGVCGACSSKHERESYARGGQSLRVEVIRVCTRCMDRVDQSNYSNLSDASVMGPVVVPNSIKPAATTLKELLHDALLHAPSQQRQQSVMAVIKCVVDQADNSPRISTSATRSLPSVGPLTPSSSVADYVAALDYVDVNPTRSSDMEFADDSGRGYLYDSRHPEDQMAYPVPANEAKRLQVIRDSHIMEMGKSEELNIICDLAAKELDSFASLVTIITEEEQQVVAANMPMLENARFPRAHAFCSHLVMDNKPLLVPHPEADIRFQLNGPVQNMGARFYCGFPLVAEDNETVIGSLCCVDNKTRELTEAQYAALDKLAKTAAKVVRIQAATQRKSLGGQPSRVQL